MPGVSCNGCETRSLVGWCSTDVSLIGVKLSVHYGEL